jgi:hypothetical protein
MEARQGEDALVFRRGFVADESPARTLAARATPKPFPSIS